MKKFKFELEDILKFRKFEQNQAEVELGKALAVEQEIQSKLDNLAQQKHSASEYIRGSKNFTDITNVLYEKKKGDKLKIKINYPEGRKYQEKEVEVTLS